jgi:hypothetical protein
MAILAIPAIMAIFSPASAFGLPERHDSKPEAHHREYHGDPEFVWVIAQAMGPVGHAMRPIKTVGRGPTHSSKGGKHQTRGLEPEHIKDPGHRGNRSFYAAKYSVSNAIAGQSPYLAGQNI